MNKVMEYLKNHNIYTFVKFGITGAANTIIDFLVFTLLSSLFYVDIYISQVIAYLSGMLNSYIVNRSWTFHAKESFFGGQLVRFIITNLSMLLLSLFLLKIFSGYFPKLISKLFVTAITTVLNFIISKLWVYKK